MRSFSGGMGGETDPSTDPGIMVQAERNVALADFNNWGVTEISVDDNGVVTAIADGQVRTVTLADGERGSIIIDGNDTGYELQQGRESGWTLVPTFVEEPAYYGERTVALADFNNWGVTEIAIDDAGVVTAIADQIARTVTIDEAGIVSVEGVATDFIVYNDGTNTGLQQIYTMVDDFPGDNGGVPEVEAPVHEIFLADFNNWGVTQINVADDGTVTALADSQARAASVDADTREISVDGVATGYTLAQGRESGYTLVASHILYMSNGGPIQNNNGAGPGDIPVLEPTSVPSGFEGEANAFVFISLAPSFTRGESVATGLFASKSIVDQDEQSVL